MFGIVTTISLRAAPRTDPLESILEAHAAIGFEIFFVLHVSLCVLCIARTQSSSSSTHHAHQISTRQARAAYAASPAGVLSQAGDAPMYSLICRMSVMGVSRQMLAIVSSICR